MEKCVEQTACKYRFWVLDLFLGDIIKNAESKPDPHVLDSFQGIFHLFVLRLLPPFALAAASLLIESRFYNLAGHRRRRRHGLSAYQILRPFLVSD